MTNTATVMSHEILMGSTEVFSPYVPSALTPELALGHLGELSGDVRAAVLLDANGELAAGDPEKRGTADELRELVLELLATADAADEKAVAEIEVTGPTGAVFVVRGRRFTLAVVTDRFALSSLIRYDLRRVLADLDRGPG